MESYGFCFATSVLSSIFCFRWACSTLWFFLLGGGTDRREGGWVWILPCIAKAHFHGRKKSSPLWALNSISSYCVYSPTLTLFLREMISFADVERNTHTKDCEDFYKKQGDGAYRCATDKWAEKEENILQNMGSFENQIDSEGAVSRIQGWWGWVQRSGCVEPAHCVTQQESERHSLVKATG